MRRLVSTLSALVFLASLVGCYHTHSSGVCDCDPEEDPCFTRSPWVKHPAYAPGPNTVNGHTNGYQSRNANPNMATPVVRDNGY